MSDQTPYEKLGVNEGATFDQIQEARNRLVAQYEGDRKHVEAIETAYDAILMDRLRLRQEGRIKVPDRIRFPEKLAAPSPSSSPTAQQSSAAWLQRLVDTPSRKDILLSGCIFGALGALVSLSPTAAPVALAVGILANLYLLNRKEHKLGRAFLLTLAGCTIGIFVGLQLHILLQAQVNLFAFASETIAAWTTLGLLWLISSFLR